MARNHNIQTVSEHQTPENITSQTITIGAIVPAGMTRYVTFIRLTPLTAANNKGSKVYFCSGTVGIATSVASASASKKMVVCVASELSPGAKEVMIPQGGPDTEHPLFTIASGAYLRSHHASAQAMSGSVIVFVQYYDE